MLHLTQSVIVKFWYILNTGLDSISCTKGTNSFSQWINAESLLPKKKNSINQLTFITKLFISFLFNDKKEELNNFKYEESSTEQSQWAHKHIWGQDNVWCVRKQDLIVWYNVEGGKLNSKTANVYVYGRRIVYVRTY